MKKIKNLIFILWLIISTTPFVVVFGSYINEDLEIFLDRYIACDKHIGD